MDRLRVGIVYGGRSVEHEVSIASATSILQALDPTRYEVALVAVSKDGRWHLGAPGTLPEEVVRGDEVRLPAVPGERTLVSARDGRAAARLDVVLPIVHGTGGEDGSLQGFLELAGVPYVGAGVLGSAIQMDKEVSKRLLAAAGLPVVPGVCVRRAELERDAAAAADRAREAIGLPAFVKPACLGSSVGISKVRRAEELLPALREAARYDAKILVERAMDAREIEVAVLGNDEPEASLPGEIVPHADFYDYQSKYVDEGTELLVPAPLDETQTARVRELALQAFRTLEGQGLARVDFFLERDGGALFLNEVNSLPGFTEVSMYPRLWQATGLSYSALLDRLIELALERHRADQALERSYRVG
ncbi:MAG: D-alanine--D-alanine ligase family protein [Myxococcota bacterium]|nr:D-alanine--D-alanine ligase family protein [Myxococcota bacterium]